MEYLFYYIDSYLNYIAIQIAFHYFADGDGFFLDSAARAGFVIMVVLIGATNS